MHQRYVASAIVESRRATVLSLFAIIDPQWPYMLAGIEFAKTKLPKVYKREM